MQKGAAHQFYTDLFWSKDLDTVESLAVFGTRRGQDGIFYPEDKIRLVLSSSFTSFSSSPSSFSSTPSPFSS
jgi:hypothetical protein